MTGAAGTSARDRAIGALVGLAAGDAVGTTVEFRAPGSFEPLTDLVGGGPFGLPRGAWTDDTSMAMCLAESVLDVGGLVAADQLRRYVRWWRDGYWSSTGKCFDIGTTTRAALARYERTGAVVDDVVDEDSAANGSLMRLAPVPIRWHRDLAAAAERSGASSRTTHAARRPVDACRLMGTMVAALIGGSPADAVLDPAFWQFGELHPEVAAVARGSWRDKEPPVIRGTGYCVAALEAALWAVGGAQDFRQAVLRAANLGDDADTTAAIAGQLAGARWGWSAIPEDWRRALTDSERIGAIASRLFDAGVGAEPATVWPHDEFLHAWWAYPGSVLAGEYPGHPDPVRKVNLLVDHGVRTFVDLTMPDDGLAPYGPHVAAAAEARRLDLRHVTHPIPDMGVLGVDDYDAIIRTIRDATAHGVVYVHCWGGVGRTGTVVGCLLIDDGLDAQAALQCIEERRAGSRKAEHAAPETDTQRDLLHTRARRS